MVTFAADAADVGVFESADARRPIVRSGFSALRRHIVRFPCEQSALTLEPVDAVDVQVVLLVVQRRRVV
eukprot:9613601-Heterocapsa_arctica.AAC.1